MDPMQAMSMMKMLPMGGKPGGMGQMGMSILQAALNQRGQDQKALAAQPAAGAVMPGVGGAPGPMNITAPQQPVGMLAKLLGGFGGGGAPAAGGLTGGLGGLY